MKFLITTAIVSTVALSACAPTIEEPTAADMFIGKELTTENGAVFLFNDDGTVGGSMRGQDIVGEYSADATEICSTYTSPDFLVGSEFCSTPAVDGDTVVFNRRDGSQSPVYTIGG